MSDKLEELKNEIRTAFDFFMSLDENSSIISIMGRSSNRPESLFENILTVPTVEKYDEEYLIVKIWKKLELGRFPEIISVVSTKTINIDESFLTGFYFTGKSSWTLII